MRYLFILVCSLFLFNSSILGQNQKYRLLTDSELSLINDVISTFEDVNKSIVISPLICYSINLSSDEITVMINKYGFAKSQFKNTLKDTLLVKDNKYFKVINPDSLLKYQNYKFDIDFCVRENINFIHTPILYFIEKNYKESGICYFYKPIFSKDKTYAIAEYLIYNGDSWGETVLMKKKNGKWILIESLGFVES